MSDFRRILRLQTRVEALEQGGGGGGSDPLTLLGPYTINFDDAGLLNPSGYGNPIADLAAGTVILHAWIESPVAWAVAGECIANLVVAAVDDSAAASIGFWDLTNTGYGYGPFSGYVPSIPYSPTGGGAYVGTSNIVHSGRVVGAQKLAIAVYPQSTDPTAGTANIYVLAIVP